MDIREEQELRETMPEAQAIGPEQLRRLTEILQRYKAGKAATERRILSSEQWWKLRNSWEERDKATMASPGFKSRSGWLHNVITSKHADAMESYPEPNILPREEGDRQEARMLSAIVPCVLEQNEFERTYSDAMWQKCKTGTGVYKTVWDPGKLNGLGDISITRVNLLNLYWEPGLEDIQRSRYFFHTELADRDLLQEQYPELEDTLKGQNILSTRFLYDDTVSTDGKVTVVECYYHKLVAGKKTLQYVRYVGDQVLYATENDPELRERGLYDHGLYPYVFDALYPIEGSPCGYGYVDLCRNPQTEIDLLRTAIVKNAMAGATPRYFVRSDGGINEQELLDISKPLVHISGNLGEDSIRAMDYTALQGNYISVLQETVQELRETSGNTETATGTAPGGGITAASAIAALQEASGKGSRDATLASYRAYTGIVGLVIELIRQFYDMPRQFRILGEQGGEEYVTYTNAGLKPQPQGMAFGEDMGFRLPVFDIKVSAQKKSAYTKMSQNELALQFYQLGFFSPDAVDQTMLCLEMMDFDGKDGMMQRVAQQGTLRDKLGQYMQLALTLAAKAAPEMVQGLSQDILQTMGGGAVIPQGQVAAQQQPEAEHPYVQQAREQSRAAAEPEEGPVMV
jgi:hypothetical protein|nr:MAG TPA_asm: Portal protein [Caudoviricetes sp.]